MGFLKNFFLDRDEQQMELAKLQRQIDSFMRPSRAQVDGREMTIPEKRQRYALFTFGAICGLMETKGDEECDETRILAVLVMHFKGLDDMHEQDASYLINRCIELKHDPERATTIQAGRQAALQWASGDAGTAIDALAAVMQD